MTPLLRSPTLQGSRPQCRCLPVPLTLDSMDTAPAPMGSIQHCRCQLPKMGDTWSQLPWPGPPHPAMLLVSLLLAAGVMHSDAGTSCPVLCTCHNQVVDCSSQRLFSVPPDLPMGTRNLSLAHNRITTVPPGYLTCYMELRVLDLRNNSLIELPPGLFLHAKRLAHLDLSYNNLSHVPADMFQEAHGLVHIDLSHNPWLRRVHPQAFQGLMQLRDLDLSYGGLAFLSLEALEGLPGLVTLQIGGNPWVCGCTMEPLLKWLRNRIQRCTSDSCCPSEKAQIPNEWERDPRSHHQGLMSVQMRDSSSRRESDCLQTNSENTNSQLAECRGPPEVEGAPLFSLTEESFKACHLTLTLDDYLFIAFVGFVVSIASVATNFLLGITANCCHRWSKASEEEEI